MAEEWNFLGCTLQDIYSKLGSPCVVTLTNRSEHSGYLYNIDPETYTLFLLKRQDQGQTQDQRPDQEQQHVQEGPEDKVETGDADNKDAWTMIVVRRHALKSCIFQDEPDLDRLSVQAMDSVARIPHALADPTQIGDRKRALVAMLESKRIPVQVSDEDAVVHIMNSAHVHPPYLPSTVKCANGVILERVKGMLQEFQG
ncbi:hypothetical protein B0O80DRAFT_497919 [Mortierella sp. GBAus27b]|nr:hypothetical protein BGX31_006770 [Mortierella sp. GBA43]KAI8354700.1 hypothetical protein B0O80DRAFT_497919 [Mortierella sp. GBAus27b]